MTVPSVPPAGAILRRVDSPADHFTMISNEFLRDRRLSYFARGLGAELLSHREGWEITTTALASAAGVGRDKVRRALVELEHHRYLRRVRQRAQGGILGPMLYLVRCTPFPPEPEGNPRSDQRLNGQALDSQSLVPGHHKKTSPKDNIPQKKTPSGGSLRDSAPPPTPTQEDPMPRTAPQSEALPLDLPEQAKAQGRKDEPSARTVVAAFVDSYRQHHSGGNPTRAVIGRVSRSAKAILTTGTAGPAELTAAAAALGTGPHANLDTALSMHRQKGSRHMGTVAPCPPRGTFAEASNEADRKFRERLKVDPELAAWIVTDKAEVAKLIAVDPELADVFAKVGAA